MKNVIKIFRYVLGFGLLFTMFIGMFMYTQIDIILEAKSIQKTLTEQREVALEVELTAVTDIVMSTNKQIDFWKAVSTKLPFLFLEDFKNLERVK